MKQDSWVPLEPKRDDGHMYISRVALVVTLPQILSETSKGSFKEGQWDLEVPGKSRRIQGHPVRPLKGKRGTGG